MTGNKLSKKFLFGIITLKFFLIGGVYLSLYGTTNRFKILKDETRESNSSTTTPKTNFSNSSSPVLIRKEEIIILFWTTFFRGDPLLFREDIKGEIERHPDSAGFKNCHLSTNRSLLNVSDAVIFHSRDLKRTDLPPVHKSDQVWIYLQMESPSYTHPNLAEYANVFNWTVTYRRDSDLWNFYGKIVKRTINSPSNWTSNFVLKERKMVLWIVSNCKTKGKREVIVRRLQQLVPVDIYGKCGINNCSRPHDHPEGCLPVIAPQYKFYLAFENSLCWDYITEKFYNALKFNLVPIVFGGADYKAFAPPNSFIDASKFGSVKALADYLKYLNQNDEKYLEYFKWKAHYQIEDNYLWCRLCEKLKQHKRNPERKMYGDLWKWWNTKPYNLESIVANASLIFNETDDKFAVTSIRNYIGSGQSFLKFHNTAACVNDAVSHCSNHTCKMNHEFPTSSF